MLRLNFLAAPYAKQMLEFIYCMIFSNKLLAEYWQRLVFSYWIGKLNHMRYQPLHFSFGLSWENQC
jgi:hypothetical protein